VQCFQNYAPDIGRPKGYFDLAENGLRFHPPEFGWFHYLAQQSYVLGVIDDACKITRRHYADGGKDLRVADQDQPRVYRALLQRIRESSRQAGAELRIVYIPARYQQQRNVLQELLADWTATHQVPYLDLSDTPPFADREAAKSCYFQVDMHINVDGHRRVAEQLVEFVGARVAAETLVDRVPAPPSIQ
jgi:hypothetical protein